MNESAPRTAPRAFLYSIGVITLIWMLVEGAAHLLFGNDSYPSIALHGYKHFFMHVGGTVFCGAYLPGNLLASMLVGAVYALLMGLTFIARPPAGDAMMAQILSAPHPLLEIVLTLVTNMIAGTIYGAGFGAAGARFIARAEEPHALRTPSGRLVRWWHIALLAFVINNSIGFARNYTARKEPKQALSASAAETYDPDRDPRADIQEAVKRAKAERKRVLVVIGGDWCSWCKILDLFYKANPDIAVLRDRNFVVVKVYIGTDGQLPKALETYPPPAGAPHIYVLADTGVLVHSLDTREIESGESYDREKLTEYLTRWAPPR